MAGRPLRRARMNPALLRGKPYLPTTSIPFTLDNLQRAAAFIYSAPDIAQGVNDFCERWGEVKNHSKTVVDSYSHYPAYAQDNTLHVICAIFFATHPNIMDTFQAMADDSYARGGHLRQFVRATLLNSYAELVKIYTWFFSLEVDYGGSSVDLPGVIAAIVGAKGRDVDLSSMLGS